MGKIARSRLFDKDLRVNNLGGHIGVAVCCSLVDILKLVNEQGIVIDIRDFHYVVTAAAASVVSHVALKERLTNEEAGFTEQMIDEAIDIVGNVDEEKIEELAKVLRDFVKQNEEERPGKVIEFTKKGGK